MTLDDLLHEQAARLSLGRLPPEEMLATIDRALDEGLYVDALLEAIDAGPRPPFDQPLKAYTALLASRSIVVPERKQAVWRIVEHHVRRIAANETDARVALQALIDAVYWDLPEFREKTKKYVGDPFGLEQLVGNHWSFDDIEDRPDDISVNGFYGAAAIEEMKRLSRVEAVRWLAAWSG